MATYQPRSIRAPAELWTRIEDESRRDLRTVTSMILKLLTEALDARDAARSAPGIQIAERPAD